MNNISKIIKSQISHKENWPSVINPIEYISYNLTPAKKRILNNLLYFQCKYRTISPNQSTIARLSGVRRETANRLLKELQEEGFISLTYRHLTSCIYTISPWFRNVSIVSQLRHIFPALKAPVMITLLLTSTACSATNVTQKKIKSKSLNFKISYSRARARNRFVIPAGLAGLTESFKKNIQGEGTVNYIQSIAATKLRSFSLTKAGHIALAAFPDKAIVWADERFFKRINIKDKFRYFISLCLQYCNDNGIRPDWDLSRQLAYHFKIENNPTYIEIKVDSKSSFTPAYKSSFNKPYALPLKKEISQQKEQHNKQEELKKLIKHKEILQKSCRSFCEKWCPKCDLARIIIKNGVMDEQGYFSSLASNLQAVEAKIKALSP